MLEKLDELIAAAQELNRRLDACQQAMTEALFAREQD